jgi:hypothetical protein
MAVTRQLYTGSQKTLICMAASIHRILSANEILIYYRRTKIYINFAKFSKYLLAAYVLQI